MMQHKSQRNADVERKFKERWLFHNEIVDIQAHFNG